MSSAIDGDMGKIGAVWVILGILVASAAPAAAFWGSRAPKGVPQRASEALPGARRIAARTARAYGAHAPASIRSALRVQRLEKLLRHR
jgi:hypothetical protein